MKKINAFFMTRKKLTLALLGICFAVSLTIAILSVTVFPGWSFWAPYPTVILTFYFFWLERKINYDPRKDRLSDQYVPYKDRKKK